VKAKKVPWYFVGERRLIYFKDKVAKCSFMVEMLSEVKRGERTTTLFLDLGFSHLFRRVYAPRYFSTRTRLPIRLSNFDSLQTITRLNSIALGGSLYNHSTDQLIPALKMGKLTNWKDHTVQELEEICRGRQLDSGGLRPDLVARLIDYELEKMQLDFQGFCISPDTDPQGKKSLLKEATAVRDNFELGAKMKKAAFYEYADSIEKDSLRNSSQKYNENIAFIGKMAGKQENVVPIRLKQQSKESSNSVDGSFEAKPQGTEMEKRGIDIEAAWEGVVCKDPVDKQSVEKQAIEKGLFKKDQDKMV
jgi:hypothetical protein